MMQYPNRDDLQAEPSEYPYSPMLGVGIMVWVLVVYLALRNAGHALGLLFSSAGAGGVNLLFVSTQELIKDTSILDNIQITLRSLGGMLLPLLTWAGFMLLAPRKGFSALESLKLITSVGMLASLIGWVFLPLSYVPGQTRGSEDVSLFLQSAGWNGPLTGGLFVFIFVGCILLARKRISSYASLRDVLQGRASDLDYASHRGFYLATAMILGATILASIVLRLLKG